jgi:hypothetical protein
MNTLFLLWKKTLPQCGSNTNNTHISDITEDSDPSHYLAHAFNSPFPNMQLKFSTTEEILSIIKSFKPRNIRGYDEISTKLLKTSSAHITSSLNHICNTSLLLGAFPQPLKYSIVKLLFKRGDRTYFQLQTNIHIDLFLKNPSESFVQQTS